MTQRASIWRDLALVMVLTVLSAVVFVATADLPVPRWEPIGPAALPRAIAVLLLLLSSLLLVRRLLGLGGAVAEREALGYVPRYGRAAALVAVMAAGAAAMNLGWLSYRPMAFLAVVLGGLIVCGFDRRHLLSLALMGLVLALGIHFLLTSVLITRLP